MKTLKSILNFIGDLLGYTLLFSIYYINRLLKAPLWFVDTKTFNEWNGGSKAYQNQQQKDVLNIIVITITTTLYYLLPKWAFWSMLSAGIITIGVIVYYHIKRTKK